MSLNFSFALALTWLIAQPVSASTDQMYGLGGRTTGRVGSMTAESENPFAALQNPALLASGVGRQMGISTYTAGARYNSFGVVQIDSVDYRTTNGVDRMGETRLPDFSTTLWALGYRHGFDLPFWDHRVAGVGLVFSGPIASLRTFSSPTPYDFTSLRYGTSDTQFKGSASLGLELFPKVWSLGAGVSIFISGAGTSDTVIAAENPTARMKMDVSMNSSLILGNYFRFGDWSAALVYRQRIRPRFAQQLQGQVDFAGTRVFNQPMLIESTLYFEPNIFELEIQRPVGRVKLSAGVSLQLWNAHEPSFMRVTADSRNGQARSTSGPTIPFRNIFVPRASIEVPFNQGRWNTFAGYQYRPSPIVDLSGTGNLLDSNTHILGLGAGVRIARDFLGTQEMHLNLSGQLHLMENRRVEKAASGLIGSPGYDFKGRAYVIGLSAEMSI